jgi:formylglycine-generating enzyme
MSTPLKDKIRQLVAAGKTHEAINLLTSSTVGKAHNESIILSSRLTELEEDSRLGNITMEQRSASRSKLNWDILHTVDALEIENHITNIPFVLVKGGTFKILNTHQVTLKDFYIGKYLVTQEEWKEIMGENPSYFKFKGDNLPVENVSWDDAQEFIRKLNAKTGSKYRLPNAVEWEFAARGGTLSKGFEFAGSNNLDEVGWFLDNSGNKTHPVGQKKPNELGLYDMSGNVWEWCDEYGKEKWQRMLRGGSSHDYPPSCRTVGHWHNDADYRDFRFGFRLALSAI